MVVITSHFLPTSKPGLSSLREHLSLDEPAEEVTVMAGTASASWFLGMADALLAARSVSMRFGLDLGISPNLPALISQNAQDRNWDCRLVKSYDGSYFHPKVYVAKFRDRFHALVGSSNASTLAFGSNVEANLLLTGERGDDESIIDGIISGIHAELGRRELDRRAISWRLPDDFETIPPHLLRRAPVASEFTADTNDWQADPGLARAQLIADFFAPLSGITTYVAGTSHQGGFDIEDTQIPAVERLIPQGEGANLLLRWQFISADDVTIFQYADGPRLVRQSGYGGNNRVITARKPDIARPLVAELERIGCTEGEVHVLYKLQEGNPRTLWMIHTLPIDLASGSERPQWR